MRRLCQMLVACVLLTSAQVGRSAELPGRYFRLLAAELSPVEKMLAANPKIDLARIEARPGDRHFPGTILAAAVLYTKKHADNPHHSQRRFLDLALRIGDLLAAENETDAFQKRQDNDWDLYMWLEAYRLLDKELGDVRRARWRKEIEKDIRKIADDAMPRVDFPRYQGPFLRTSTNHYSLWASPVYLAGKMFGNKEWEGFGQRAMHRLATEEQTPDGYWGENTDNGPTTGYNYLTMAGVALYYEHSHDKAALESLRRATDFHKHYTYPDGTPVEVINGRNRHWGVSAWGHFGFSHFTDGRRYAEFLTRFFPEGKVGYHGLGRLAQSALYYHEGPTSAIPQDLPGYAHRMRVPAGIRKSGPWVVWLSGLIDTPTDSQFTLDRQGNISVFHETLGLIITGANSKRQPDLATFVDRSGPQAVHLPTSSRLRMADDRDRLGLAYPTFFAEMEVPTPTPDQTALRVVVTETGRNRLKEAQMTLQLCLKAGEVLETGGGAKVVLGEKHVELGSKELGGVIHHRGWTLKVDPSARLTWPVYPFNPYRNAPETELRHAVGALTVPIAVKPPASTLPWRTQEISFSIDVPNASARKAPTELPGDQAIQKHLANRADQLERDPLAGIRGAAEFEMARPAARREYLDMLGLAPMPVRTPLKAVVTGRLEREGYSVEKLHFQSLPGLYVTANLYLPRPAPKQPCPAILYQCGHASQMKRHGNKAAPECQSHGVWFATHGYVALVMDTLELGEIASVHRGPLRNDRWWWLSAGYTPAGVECWNAIRALDYLVTRPEVDPDRIGATGISGGGVGTLWVAAADDRVKAAAPVSGVGDLRFYAGAGGVGRHCDCFFFPNRARWDWLKLAALICPRPLLLVNSDNDSYFPMAGNDRYANRLERLYSLFGAGDRVDAVVSIGGHGYRTDVRRAVFEFFNRHLKEDARKVIDADAAEPPPKGYPNPPGELRVFPRDDELPRDQRNTRIDETFVARAKVELPPAEKLEVWRRDLLERLRKASFAAWPTVEPGVPTGGWQEKSEARETTEDGIEVYWRWLPGKDRDATPWLIVLNPGDDGSRPPAWARDVVGDGSMLLLCPRGVGPVAWTRDVFPNSIERSFPLLGATSDSGRVWDVKAIARRQTRDKTGWRAAGRGQAGIIAAYAALYEPAIVEVVAIDPPPSHQPALNGGVHGPPMLNVLRVLDIPEALGCLAPRRLVLVDASAKAFDRTATLYQRAGAADRFERRSGKKE